MTSSDVKEGFRGVGKFNGGRSLAIRKEFEKWMRSVEEKASGTVNAYANAINDLSKHYSDQIGNDINIYDTIDCDHIKHICNKYDKGGEFAKYGEKNNNTLKSAFKAFVRFLESQESLINSTSFSDDASLLGIESEAVTSFFSLNTILYGAPGTGKTYNTINKALEILDKPFFDANINDRNKLKKRFDELRQEGKIAFTTFHQSFSYEDFVEGIRAEVIDDKINYIVKPGIFKVSCKSINCTSNDGFLKSFEILKKICSNDPLKMQTKQGNIFYVSFVKGKGLIKIESYVSEKIYYIHEDDMINNHFNNNIKGSDEKIKIYVKSILEYMMNELIFSDSSVMEKHPVLLNYPRVLIIDEINRGNIANIFGELITLIEPSKRAGEPEALSVTLPYSKEEFSVPNNLYIIGTMNTADRSLALMDTALRRRFHFEEMMPKPELLAEIDVEGVDIQRLLERMNARITALYDREHTLGHAFFMPLREEPTLAKLREVFERQILPLLQEYFFEDWNKIRLVVGKDLIIEEAVDADLFDENPEGLVNPKTYRINHAALDKVETYIRIYDKAAKLKV